MANTRWMQGWMGALALTAFAAALTSADEPRESYRVQVKQAQPGPLRTIYQKVQERQLSKHWIGVGCEPVGDALKSQLGVDHGLLVQNVGDEQPAAKAGIRQHDVLLEFGKQKLSTVEDLIAAVDQSEGKESSVVLLRAGKQIKLEVTPIERPKLEAGEDAKVRIWNLADGGFNIQLDPRQPRVVGLAPGILLRGDGKLPEGLHVTISKKGDSPAQITVEKGDNKWSVEEGKLDDLPESVREDVKRFLGQRPLPGIVPGSGNYSYRLTLPPAAKGPQQEPPEGPRAAPSIRLRSLQMNEGSLRQELEEMTKKLESFRDRLRGDDVLEEIRHELKALRRDVDELRKQHDEK